MRGESRGRSPPTARDAERKTELGPEPSLKKVDASVLRKKYFHSRQDMKLDLYGSSEPEKDRKRERSRKPDEDLAGSLTGVCRERKSSQDAGKERTVNPKAKKRRETPG